MKLLHLLSSVDPKGGGPTEGVLQRGRRLLEMGHQIEVLTLDDPDAPFLASYPLRVYALGPSRGTYRYNPRLVPWLRANAGDYDAVTIEGLWQYHGLAAWRVLRGLNVPYFVFTHGMLDPWFKATYPLKHLKKWLYWPWADYRVLRDANAVLFTSEEERLLARRSFWLYKARELVVAFGTGTPPGDGTVLREFFFSAYPALRGKRILLFLGRIHPKKGCDLLIQAFATIAHEDPSVHLIMAGPSQTGWRLELQAEAQRLQIAERILWPGMVQDHLKWGAFYASEAFVLPSHQENFGIAVAEALGTGLPVLISDKVNIWREIVADGAGFVAPDTKAGTAGLLRRWFAIDEAQRQATRAAASRSFKTRFTVNAMAEDFIRVVQEATA